MLQSARGSEHGPSRAQWRYVLEEGDSSSDGEAGVGEHRISDVEVDPVALQVLATTGRRSRVDVQLGEEEDNGVDEGEGVRWSKRARGCRS